MWITIITTIPIAGFLWLVLTIIAREVKKSDDREKFIDQLMKDKQKKSPPADTQHAPN